MVRGEHCLGPTGIRGRSGQEKESQWETGEDCPVANHIQNARPKVLELMGKPGDTGVRGSSQLDDDKDISGIGRPRRRSALLEPQKVAWLSPMGGEGSTNREC